MTGYSIGGEIGQIGHGRVGQRVEESQKMIDLSVGIGPQLEDVWADGGGDVVQQRGVLVDLVSDCGLKGTGIIVEQARLGILMMGQHRLQIRVRAVVHPGAGYSGLSQGGRAKCVAFRTTGVAPMRSPLVDMHIIGGSTTQRTDPQIVQTPNGPLGDVAGGRNDSGRERGRRHGRSL